MLALYFVLISNKKVTLRKKCLYLEFFRSAFSHIRTEYDYKSPGSVQMWENADQKNSEHGQFLRSVTLYKKKWSFPLKMQSYKLCNNK